MEGVIGNIVSKIDKVLIKLESMEKTKSKKKQNLGKLFDGLTTDGGNYIYRTFFFNLTNKNLDLGHLKVNYRADYDLVNCL